MNQTPETESIVRICPSCGTRNRIANDKIDQHPKCGKCHQSLEGASREKQGVIKLRCTDCWTKNQIPLNKMDNSAKCGKCGSELKTNEVVSGTAEMISDDSFEETVLGSPLPVLLFAWAPWCPTCRSIMPSVDAFARDAKGKIRVAKVNLDTNPDISSRYNILSVPRIFIFDKGALLEELPGALEKHDMMAKMAHYIL